MSSDYPDCFCGAGSGFLLRFACFISLATALLHAEDSKGGPNLLAGNFETGQPSYNPWAGVDDVGRVHVLSGVKLAVNDDGRIQKLPFSPSVSVGDLNGDDLPDLVVADARGYFWFFANSGKPNAPAFTQGEIMPIWLCPDDKFHDGDIIPHIQLIDYTGEKKLSLVASNFAGQLFYIRNGGSAASPRFASTYDLDLLEVPTHSDKLLWCNYLAPFLYDWSGTGRLDLTMGDGSYSANSIYLFTNKGTNDRPTFREDNRTKIIPGMGKEQLVPQVVDWNNDGKPDILTGERAGFVDIFLNQATDKHSPPVFDPDKFQHVIFGNSDKVGQFPTICVADLNHDGLFDLILGNGDGVISYALNIGTLGSPKFGPLIPLKGVYPYQRIYLPLSWQIEKDHPFGSPGGLLETVNAQSDPDFTPPPDFAGKGGMKFSVVKPKAVYFNEQYVPKDMTRSLIYANKINLQLGVRYTFSLWVRSPGDISDIQWFMDGGPVVPGGETTHLVMSDKTVGTPSSTWTKLTQTIRVDSATPQKPNAPQPMGSFAFFIRFQGSGTLYFDDISLTKAE